jgi:hypothetical protein
MRLTFCALFAVLTVESLSQNFSRTPINVLVNGSSLNDPWAGGLNSCQVSTFDANLDGVKDLFVFDRNGGKFSVFINESATPGTYNYRYTQAYNDLFPVNLRNWVLLRDMNCDGKEDICANSGSGFKIYLNTSSESLSFDTTVNPNIQALYEWDGSEPLVSGIFCISPDVPAIDDYDGDGDMDMWSWNEFSSALYFFKNMAVENGDCSASDFICRNRCYGMFGESSESFTLLLHEDFECDFNVINPRGDDPGPYRHTGGTTAMYDLDNNGLKDLIIGDAAANSLTALMLAESSTGQDSVAAVHYDFPASFGAGTGIDMITFLGGYFIDINNDQVLDLVVSPNADLDARDQRSVLLYINEGTNTEPEFVEVIDNFLQSEMVDLGAGAYPTLGDMDGDGLTDLLVSNRKRFDLNETYSSRLHLFKNIGTSTEPEFAYLDANFLDIPSMQWLNIHPSLGDLNGDSRPDLVIGDLMGNLHYFANTTTAGNVAFSLSNVPLMDETGEMIDVGQSATPQVFDVDNDGLNDLLVGSLNGSVAYYRNTGTAQAAAFTWVTDSLGQAVASSLLGIQGKSVPCMFRDADGTHLLIGTEPGNIMKFSGVDGNLGGVFTLDTDDYNHIREGARTAPAAGDLNGDQIYDLIIGNTGGGLAYWQHVPTGVRETPINEIEIFPNPGSDLLSVIIPENGTLPAELSIMDVQGRMISRVSLASRKNVLEIVSLQNGCYVLHVNSANFSATVRYVVSR